MGCVLAGTGPYLPGTIGTDCSPGMTIHTDAPGAQAHLLNDILNQGMNKVYWRTPTAKSYSILESTSTTESHSLIYGQACDF